MPRKIRNIELSYLKFEEYQELKEAMIESYITMPDTYWKESRIKALIEKFPEGQVVLKVNRAIAGCALSIVVDYDKFDDQHTYREITGNYTFDTHDENGTLLYGIDVFIRPEFSAQPSYPPHRGNPLPD